MLRFPHCPDNQLTDGGKVVSPTHDSYNVSYLYEEQLHMSMKERERGERKHTSTHMHIIPFEPRVGFH
jgi:hypothetical protein